MNKGWIGVDLDGTLAEWHPGQNIWTIGKPIPTMVDRVKIWLLQNREVKIVTARVAASGIRNDDGDLDDTQFSIKQRKMIQNWCMEHIGATLEVRSGKDFLMIELWDDRCVKVETNTGQIYER